MNGGVDMSEGAYDTIHGIKMDYVLPSLEWLKQEYKAVTERPKPLSSSERCLYNAIQILVDKGLYENELL